MPPFLLLLVPFLQREFATKLTQNQPWNSRIKPDELSKWMFAGDKRVQPFIYKANTTEEELLFSHFCKLRKGNLVFASCFCSLEEGFGFFCAPDLDRKFRQRKATLNFGEGSDFFKGFFSERCIREFSEISLLSLWIWESFRDYKSTHFGLRFENFRQTV